MSAAASLQQLSDEIVALASEMLRASDAVKRRELAEFVRAKPQRQQDIVAALHLSKGQFDALIAAAEASASGNVPGTQLWDYDVKTATADDLTRRRDILKDRVRVLDYLRVH